MKKSDDKLLSESRLVEILNGLSKSEMKEFGVFIKSPFINRSRALIKLYALFKKKHDRNELLRLTKSEISSVVFSPTNEDSDDSNLRKIMSNFSKVAGQFLLMKHFDSNEFIGNSILLNEFASRNCTKNFEKKYKTAISDLNTHGFKNTNYYYHLMRTEQLYFQFKSSELPDPEIHLNKISLALDLHYISIKLLHYYSMLNLRLHYKKEIEFDEWAYGEMIGFIERNQDMLSNEHHALYADYLSVKMLKSPDEGSGFERLKKYVEKHSDKFEEVEKHRMYIYLYNHSLYRFNKGYSRDAGEVFSIIKSMEDEKIPLWHYFAYHMYVVNAVKYAGLMDEHDWAVSFLRNAQDKIHKDIRNETVNLALAYHAFYKKDLDEAQKFLLGVDFPNYSFYIGAKSLLLKIYCCRKDVESLISQVDAIRHFLARKDMIPQRHATQFRNFVNCVSKIAASKNHSNDHEIAELLDSELSATDRQWLYEFLRK